MRPKKWCEFKAPGGAGPRGEDWTVLFSTRKDHPWIFANGENCAVAFFRGPLRGRIYLDASRPWPVIVDSLVHEIKHVSHRHLGLHKFIDEAVVNETASVEASILLQIIPQWPELP